VRSLFATLFQLTIPAGALPTDPRFVIGGDLPADLLAYYASFAIVPKPIPRRGIIIYDTGGQDYVYLILVTYVGFNTPRLACGSRNSFGVVEAWSIAPGNGAAGTLFSWGTRPNSAVPVAVAGTAINISLFSNGADRSTFAMVGGDMDLQGGSTLDVDNTSVAKVDSDVIVGRRITARGMFPNGTTTSATFVAMPGTPGDTIIKVYAATTLLVRISLTAFISPGVCDARVGININGVDTEVCVPLFFSSTGVRQVMSGEAEITGVPAGSQACAMVWRRAAGAGTMNVSTLDGFSLSVEEVAA
jgi:hypothetical protein